MASNELGTASSGLVHLTVNPARITQQPQSAVVPEGQSFALSVSAQGYFPLSYQWRRNGTSLPGSDRSSFGVNAATPDDAGEYDVIIYNSTAAMTSAVANITVNVTAPSLQSGEESDYNVAVGLPLNLTFTVFGGKPTHQQWFRDGEPIPGASSNLLHIGSIGFNDAGRYWFVAANSGGAATSSVINVIVDPLVIYNFSGGEVLWLNPVTLQPAIQSSSPPLFQWYFNDAPLEGETNSLIRFQAFDYANEGSYFLVGSNAYGAVTSSVAAFTVITQEPSAYAGPEFVRAWVGDDVIFEGSASGGPPPSLRWLFNGVPMVGRTQALLVLKNVATNQAGQYSFVAENASGVSTVSPLTLEVIREAPFFVTLPSITNAVEGSMVTLRAKAVAGPPPTYQWRKAGLDLPGQTNGSLALGKVKAGDGGVYELVARNVLGTARYQHRLTVSAQTGLDRWQWRLPKPQGSRLFDVARGNGRFVAAGKAGNLITSPDGHNWRNTTVETDADFRIVVFGNGVFLAAGSFYEPLIHTNVSKFYDDYYNHSLKDFAGIVLVSSNGIDWSPSIIPEDNYFTELTFGNGVFVASGPNTRALYLSTDGVRWEAVSREGTGIGFIVFGNGRFVGRDLGQDYSLSYSLNGREWFPSTLTGRAITFTDGRFFAWDYIDIYQSYDGNAWNRIAEVQGFTPSFVGSAGKFVGQGSLPVGQVHYSTDAVHWVPIDTGTRQEIESVIYENGEFLAVGEAGTITRSTDGVNWTSDEVSNKVDFYACMWPQETRERY
jgi:hypothetical protein